MNSVSSLQSLPHIFGFVIDCPKVQNVWGKCGLHIVRAYRMLIPRREVDISSRSRFVDIFFGSWSNTFQNRMVSSPAAETTCNMEIVEIM